MNIQTHAATAARLTMLVLAVGIALFATSYLWLSADEFSFAGQRDTYAAHLTPVRLHILSGIIALVAGALQMMPSLRAQAGLHRKLGLLYIGSVALSSIAGLEVAQHAYGGFSNTVAFTVLAGLWFSSTSCGWWQIKQGRIHQHKVWMIRSYALTFTAISLRAQLGLLQGFTPLSFADAYSIVPWLSWVGNLLFVEWFVISRMTPTKA
jgi:uncharacterized membrane protein